jgi:hypothetical protein
MQDDFQGSYSTGMEIKVKGEWKGEEEKISSLARSNSLTQSLLWVLLLLLRQAPRGQ